ncbi:MAG: hypothetical protein R6U64_02670 [Bacteroidales bacterium]
MYDIIEVLKYVIPSVVVFLTAYFLLKEFFDHETKKQQTAVIQEKVKTTLPLRLQAYERIILFLERISPQHLVMRVFKPGLSVQDFQQVLVQAIREEYAHNLSQQLYVSVPAWELVKNAKEEMIRQINTAAAQLDQQEAATGLSNKLLSMSVEKMATRKAMDYLKNEAQKNF